MMSSDLVSGCWVGIPDGTNQKAGRPQKRPAFSIDPRVVRSYLEHRKKEGSIRNLSFAPKANKNQINYEWRHKKDVPVCSSRPS